MAILRVEMTIDDSPRCPRCGKLLAQMLARPWSLRCPRCKTEVGESDPRITAHIRSLDTPSNRGVQKSI